MKRYLVYISLVVLVFIIGSALFSWSLVGSRDGEKTKNDRVPGSVIVWFKDGVSEERVKQIAAEVGATPETLTDPQFAVSYLFRVETGSEEDVVSTLRQYSEVKDAHQERVFYGTGDFKAY